MLRTVLLSGLFLMAFHPANFAQTAAMNKITFDRQGHRGCRGLMPENTIAAMLKAIDLGVTTLETDAVITKDKQVVLSHEPFFNHEISTKPNGTSVTETEEESLNIFQMEYADVKKFDVGLRAHPRFPQKKQIPAAKPLLADMIDAAEKYCADNHHLPIQYNIETKSKATTDHIYHPAPAEFVELIIKVILAKKIESRVTIQSFDIRTLQYLHQKYPAIKTALLIEDYDTKTFAAQIAVLGFNPSIYSPHYSLVTEELIENCKRNKIQIIPWTVNDKPTINRLRSMGVDGLISDYPDLF